MSSPKTEQAQAGDPDTSRWDADRRSATLGELAAAVDACLSTAERSRAGEFSLAVHEGTAKPAKTDPAYFELLLEADRLEVRLCAVSDRSAQALLDWLQDRSAMVRLRGLSDYTLTVFDRRPANLAARYSGQRPKWSAGGDLRLREELKAARVNDEYRDELVALFEGLDRRWERIGFRLHTAWRMGATTEEAVASAPTVTDSVRELLSILGPLNMAVRRSKSTQAPALERAAWRPPG